MITQLIFLLTLKPSRRPAQSTSDLNGDITKNIEKSSASEWVRVENNKRIRSPEKTKPFKLNQCYRPQIYRAVSSMPG